MTQLIQHNPNPNKTIEPDKRGDGFNVYEWGTYPKGSVLAGQDRKTFVDASSDQYELKLKYPGAEVFDHVVECTATVNANAPANYYAGDGGFYDAGEYWGEDDY